MSVLKLAVGVGLMELLLTFFDKFLSLISSCRGPLTLRHHSRVTHIDGLGPIVLPGPAFDGNVGASLLTGPVDFVKIIRPLYCVKNSANQILFISDPFAAPARCNRGRIFVQNSRKLAVRAAASVSCCNYSSC